MEAVLIWADRTKDKDGFPVESEHRAEIYVKEKSAARMEFYEAMRAGIDVKLVLETRQEDFELSAYIESEKKSYARKIEYEDCVYDIVRTYKIGKAKIELVCG